LCLLWNHLGRFDEGDKSFSNNAAIDFLAAASANGFVHTSLKVLRWTTFL
jgi:hypothetical protein